MLQKIEQLANESKADLALVNDADSLEQFRIRYLGSKGAIKGLMGLIKDVPGDQKRAFGQNANALRQEIDQAFSDKKSEIGKNTTSTTTGPVIDLSEPGLAKRMGRTHVITQTINEIGEVFGRMGFDIETGPEVEDQEHNFVKLNIPGHHPARDPLENFYVSDTELLRSQTSTIQIRVMESTPPPIRIIATGRVYRPDEHDATHYSMFHQVEGLYVDRKVNMVDLKSTLVQFAHAYLGEDADVKLYPSYFPFTEPSAELYMKMKVKGEWDWVEIGGCGMVDPNVFEAVGYDPEEWTGFAFGLGIERLAMVKYQIEDIRWLFENDVRFLRQF